MTVASLLKQHGYATACIGKWHLGLDWVDGRPGTEKQVPIGATPDRRPERARLRLLLRLHPRPQHRHRSSSRTASWRMCRAGREPAADAQEGCRVDRSAQGRREPFFLYFPCARRTSRIVPAPEFLGKSGQGPGDERSEVRRLGLSGRRDARPDPGGPGATQPGRAAPCSSRPATTAPRAASTRRCANPSAASTRAAIACRLSRAGPARVKPGSVNDHTICLNDLMATAAAIVGARLPDDAGEDSVSLLPALLGTAPNAHARSNRSPVDRPAISPSARVRGSDLPPRTASANSTTSPADLSETNDVHGRRTRTWPRNSPRCWSPTSHDGRSTPGACAEERARLVPRPPEAADETGNEESAAQPTSVLP